VTVDPLVVVATALALGSVYGLLGAAVSAVALTTRTLHLAVGPVLVVGVLVRAVAGAELLGVPGPVAVLAGLAVGAAASALLQPLVLARLPEGLAWLVGLGVAGAVLEAGTARAFGTVTLRPPKLVALPDLGPVDGAVVTAVVVGLPLTAVLAFAVDRTRWGRRLRLVGGSVEAAARGGVHAGRVRAGVLAVAGAVAVLAGLLVAPIAFVSTGQATALTVRAVAAATLLGRGGGRRPGGRAGGRRGGRGRRAGCRPAAPARGRHREGVGAGVVTRTPLLLVGLLLVGLLGVAAFGPLPVVLGAGRLVVLALLVAGAGLLVGRVGTADLATGVVAGAGAVAGGVLVSRAGLPASLGLVVGAGVGAAVGALEVAVAGRVGRVLHALTSLAVVGAAVRVATAAEALGGAAGYHAVGLLTGGDRTDLALVAVLLAGGLLVADRVARGAAAARASVAVHAPAVAASLGRRAPVDAAVVGAAAGALLGVAGAAGAALSGSFVPAGNGLVLGATLALAALVGGAAPLGPVLGALLLWGPGVVLPLVPVVGTAPPLLSTGIVALALLAWRRRRP
jgi:branched-subunit amino acid ABC-type transport system permease component/ABC-type branched-subunit amino acid transport system permease subunit